ncbi:hypothetical protein [uncultured Mucilaginibacter sp.]|uniref:hypothetical protein n=1 Tax=uncultured Mucilaginibacter sp. TaxID=797541 RepID=UPI0025D3B4D3|nr:hypothetical protein [uncultured Mucilaginibacter sp.]
MKTKHLLLLLLACSGWSACKKNTQPQCLALPLAPIMLSANVRIVDKTTSADLFLSPTSPYKLSDLSVSTSLQNATVNFWVDSVHKDKRFVVLHGFETQTWIVKLAALPADTVHMDVSVTQSRCYATPFVGKITLNGKAVCAPCSYSDVVTISK